MHELQGRRRRRKWKRQLVAAHPLLLLLLLVVVECLSIFQYHKKKYCQCLLQMGTRQMEALPGLVCVHR